MLPGGFLHFHVLPSCVHICHALAGRGALREASQPPGQPPRQGCQRGLLRRCSGREGFGHIPHPCYPRRCPLRGRPRVVTYPCAGSNVTQDLGGSHPGRGHNGDGVGLHAAEAPTAAVTVARWSRVKGGGKGGWRFVHTQPALLTAQGNAVRRAATRTGRRTGTGGLAALESCSSVAWQRVPVCAAVALRGADKGAQGTATPP